MHKGQTANHDQTAPNRELSDLDLHVCCHMQSEYIKGKAACANTVKVLNILLGYRFGQIVQTQIRLLLNELFDKDLQSDTVWLSICIFCMH